ncbi:MAG: hypothetical protein ACKO24_19605 [Leptolyngbyaceae cyanobacterium]
MNKLNRWAWKGLIAILLVLMLTACSRGTEPTRSLVQQAIALELGQAQQELGQQLRLESEATRSQINRVTITNEAPLIIEGLEAYRVRGTYDYTTALPSRKVIQRNNPFDIYLQRQQEGKTWRLAKQIKGDNGQPRWVTRRITF